MCKESYRSKEYRSQTHQESRRQEAERRESLGSVADRGVDELCVRHN